MAIRFHHPAIVVPDLERATEFYCEALGFEFVKTFGWTLDNAEIGQQVLGLENSAAEGVILRQESCFLELFRFAAPLSTGVPAERRACDYGIAHLGFQVDDINQAFRRFIDAGGKAHNSPARVGEGWAIYCRDPFGNIIELMEVGCDEPEFDLKATSILPIDSEVPQ